MEKPTFRSNLASIRELFPGRVALSVKEVSEALGRDPRTVMTAIRKGKLPSQLVGKRYAIPVAQLARWLSV